MALCYRPFALGHNLYLRISKGARIMANTPHTMTRTEERSGSTAQSCETNLADKARNVASQAADKARDAASSISDRAGEVASNLGTKAESATSAVGSTLQHAASSLREHAPASGMLGSATSRVADTLESGGRYLQETGLRGLGSDVTTMIRRNPIPALLLGIGFGFLLARASRR